MTSQSPSQTSHLSNSESSSKLIDIIKSDTNQDRWDAIVILMERMQLKDISVQCGFKPNYLAQWRSRNRSKYENRNIRSRSRISMKDTSKPPVNDEDSSLFIDRYSDELPEYGKIKPTGYVSNLNHEDWGVNYCNYKWRKQYLRDIDKKIWNKNKILIKIGRDHGKTWQMIKLFVRWCLEKKTKVICVATPAKLDEIYQAVHYHLHSDEVRRDYGDVVVRSGIKVGIWFDDAHGYRTNPSGTNMVGPNFSVQPAEGSITGLHADEGWVHLEDPVQDVKVDDAAERRRWRWFKRTVRYINSRGVDRRTKFTGNGTSKDVGDFYFRMEKEAHFPVYTIPTLEVVSGRLPTIAEVEQYTDHDHEIITSWPDVGVYKFSECPNWPPEAVMYEFIYFPEDAHAELNNDPLPMEGFEFNRDDWIEFDVNKYDLDELTKITFVDPGFGSGGSKTAILVFAQYFNKLLLIDATVKHLGATAFIDQILDYSDQYNTLEDWVEDNFVQVSRGLSAYNPLTDLSTLRLFSSPPGTTKRSRISLLGGVFGSHIIEILDSLSFKDEIMKEYLTFTSELSDSEIRKRFNALDTIAMAYTKLKSRLGKRKRPKRHSREVKTRRSKSRRMF